MGAALVAHGPTAVIASGVVKIALFIVLSPLIGLVLGFLSMLAVMWLFRRSTPRRVDKLFRRLQLLSGGGLQPRPRRNDAQKTMGIITALLYSTGYLTGEFHMPLLGRPRRATAPSPGHAVRRLADREDHGHEDHQAAAGGRLLRRDRGRAHAVRAPRAAGIPVSTTHTITGAIVGVGVSSTQRLSAVRWGVAGRIVWAWVLPCPSPAVIAAGAWLVAHALGMR